MLIQEFCEKKLSGLAVRTRSTEEVRSQKIDPPRKAHRWFWCVGTANSWKLFLVF